MVPNEIIPATEAQQTVPRYMLSGPDFHNRIAPRESTPITQNRADNVNIRNHHLTFGIQVTLLQPHEPHIVWSLSALAQAWVMMMTLHHAHITHLSSSSTADGGHSFFAFNTCLASSTSASALLSFFVVLKPINVELNVV